MGLTNFQSYRLLATAEVTIDDLVVPLDVMRVSVTSKVNTIPFMWVAAVLGRRIPSGAAMPIHFILDRLTQGVPIRLFVQVQPGPNSYGVNFESWPQDAFVLFSGTTSIVSYQRGRESVQLDIGAKGFLSACEGTSTNLGAFQARGLDQETLPFAYRQEDGKLVYDPSSIAKQFISAETLTTDFWKDGLAKWLELVCNSRTVASANDPENTLVNPNDEALASLNLFEPRLTGAYKYGVPLAIDQTALAEAVPDASTSEDQPESTVSSRRAKLIAAVATSVAADVVQESTNSITGSNLWTDLTNGIAARYGLAVIPLATSALVVPATTGYRSPYRVIYAQEYEFISRSGEVGRSWRGARLLRGASGGNFQSGMYPRSSLTADLAGVYVDPTLKGDIFLGRAPKWLTNIAGSSRGEETIGSSEVVGDALSPGGGKLTNFASISDAGLFSSAFGNRFAKAVYLTEALRDRATTISGKLRFDISPGSTVEYRVIDDPYVELQTAGVYVGAYVGEVAGVTITIDRIAKKATTAFQIINSRSYVDNINDSLSVTRHPMWAKSWNGAPLVEKSEFELWPAYLHPVYEKAETRALAIESYRAQLASPATSTLPAPFLEQLSVALQYYSQTGG